MLKVPLPGCSRLKVVSDDFDNYNYYSACKAAASVLEISAAASNSRPPDRLYYDCASYTHCPSNTHYDGYDGYLYDYSVYETSTPSPAKHDSC